MAALYEGYTLCGRVSGQSLSDSGIQGIEVERDNDHVIVTDSSRSVTLYMVSDQKPLSTWTVKQGQTFTCPAVYNSQTKEYVAVSDSKVIRIWKEEDMLLDKVFKSTVSSDIWRVHSIPGGEPVVLFKKGAMRLLDSLLTAPQQPIEEVISQDETICLSVALSSTFSRCNQISSCYQNSFSHVNMPVNKRLEYFKVEINFLFPRFSPSCSHHHFCLLDPNGHLYQSTLSVRNLGGVSEEAQALPLSRSLLLSLPVGEGPLKAASALILDEAHVAVVGVPHPSAGAGKGLCFIIKTQIKLWRYSNKLFIPHGKMLSVIPYECPKSCLSSALGKLRQAKTEGITFISPLHSNESILTNVKVCVNFLVQTAPLEEVQKEVEELLSHADSQDLQFSVGHLASALVSRSLANPSFYTSDILVQLVRTQFLCHSVCPDLLLLALERKDYFLCQLCLQFFPDIPEAMTCACLKAFISMPDADAEKVTLEPDSISFMEALIAREHGEASVQNGFSSSDDKDCSDALEGDGKARISAASEGICPVELHKAALLNEVLQTAYSDTFLLPHLKDLSSRQIILFLQYLHYLYLRYCQDASLSKPDVRSPSLTQIMDWICLLLDAHFTVLVMTPEARGLLMSLHIFVKSQVKLVSELGKIEASFQELDKMKVKRDVAQYSIEIIELL
uniref:Nucleolar protein 11 n=1 Tax=Takifugu rubripes TaxID=31033 RepID=A0A674MB38_TAKRU